MIVFIQPPILNSSKEDVMEVRKVSLRALTVRKNGISTLSFYSHIQ